MFCYHITSSLLEVPIKGMGGGGGSGGLVPGYIRL